MDSVQTIEAISGAEPWHEVHAGTLEEILKSKVVLSALREVLVASDEILKNIGMADLTNEDTIKKCLRQQGVASGLSQAVETICGLVAAAKKESAKEEG